MREWLEIFKRRRSIRSYSPEPVREEDLLAILEAGILAPSPENLQPWHFIVIRNAEMKKKMREAVAAKVEEALRSSENEEERRKCRKLRFFATHFAEAPVVIAVLCRLHYPDPQKRPLHDGYIQSIGAAVENMLLAATALGYGACWLTLPLYFAREELERLLEVREPWFLAAIVSLGKPSRIPPPTPRRPLRECVTFI